MEIFELLEPRSVATGLLDAARDGRWSLLLVFALIAVVWLFREIVLPRLSVAVAFVAWLRGDQGGAVLTLALATLGGALTSMLAGEELSIPLLATALGIGLKSIGGYVGARRLFGLGAKEATDG